MTCYKRCYRGDDLWQVTQYCSNNWLQYTGACCKMQLHLWLLKQIFQPQPITCFEKLTRVQTWVAPVCLSAQRLKETHNCNTKCESIAKHQAGNLGVALSVKLQNTLAPCSGTIGHPSASPSWPGATRGSYTPTQGTEQGPNTTNRPQRLRPDSIPSPNTRPNSQCNPCCK